MELFYEENGTRIVVMMPVEFDHYAADRLRAELDEALCNTEVFALVFDFVKTSFMDSSAIGFIMGRYEKLSAVGGSVSIRHIPERMKTMLIMSGLKKYITFEEEGAK